MKTIYRPHDKDENLPCQNKWVEETKTWTGTTKTCAACGWTQSDNRLAAPTIIWNAK